MEGFQRSDPIPVPELTVPVAVVEWFGQYGCEATPPGKQAKGDLGIISFFFLLRVGEYSLSRSKGLQHTKQFRAKDVSFFCNGDVLGAQAPLLKLETANGATMNLINQKK